MPRSPQVWPSSTGITSTSASRPVHASSGGTSVRGRSVPPDGSEPSCHSSTHCSTGSSPSSIAMLTPEPSIADRQRRSPAGLAGVSRDSAATPAPLASVAATAAAAHLRLRRIDRTTIGDDRRAPDAGTTGDRPANESSRMPSTRSSASIVGRSSSATICAWSRNTSNGSRGPLGSRTPSVMACPCSSGDRTTRPPPCAAVSGHDAGASSRSSPTHRGSRRAVRA